MYSVNKVTLIIVAATLIFSCSNKNNKLSPSIQPTTVDSTKTPQNIVPYKQIDGNRNFDGMSTSYTIYSPNGPLPKYDTTLLYNVKVTLTLLSDTTLSAVCTDSQFIMNRVFGLNNHLSKDSIYHFTKTFGASDGGSFIYDLNTDSVRYRYSYTNPRSSGFGSSGSKIILYEK